MLRRPSNAAQHYIEPLKAKLVADESNFFPYPHTRILERQKMLQTGQVLLRRPSVNFALVLPFKDSQGGTSTLARENHPQGRSDELIAG
jgi:hypothetical protein